MVFASFQEAWTMNGHGVYVWSAVGISMTVFLWLVVREWLAQRSLVRREQRRQQIVAGQ